MESLENITFMNNTFENILNNLLLKSHNSL